MWPAQPGRLFPKGYKREDVIFHDIDVTYGYTQTAMHKEVA